MNQLTRFLKNRWPDVIVVLGFIAIVLVLALPVESDSEWSGPLWAFAFTVLGVMFLCLIVITAMRLSGVDDEASGLASEVAHTPSARALVERWLRRSRYYRFVGGWIGFLVFLPFEIQPIGGALGGIAVGGALAEVHVLRRRSSIGATAEMSVRTIGDYVDPYDSAAMLALGAGAAALLVSGLLGYGADYAVHWSALAIVVLLLVRAFQYAVVNRHRPALTHELRDADNLLRLLAATQGFARPAIAVVCFALSKAVVGEGSTIGADNFVNGPDRLSELLDLVSLGLFCLGLFWWWRGRPSRIPAIAKTALAA